MNRARRLVLLLLALISFAPDHLHAGSRRNNNAQFGQFDVFIGFEGAVPEASWFPIVCEIKNDGPTFVAVVEVRPDGFGENQTRRVIVELPTGTLKRLSIPVFSTRFQRGWNVRLLDERGRVREEKTAFNLGPVRNVPIGTVLMGAIPRINSTAPVLRQVAANDPAMQPVVARFQPPIVPDNPLVFEGMDTFYINSERALELRINQVNAIMAWLNGGGHLIIGVEQASDINGTPWLRSIIPCDLAGATTVSNRGELQRWLNEFSGNMFTASRPRMTRRVGTLPGATFGNLPPDQAFESDTNGLLVANVSASRGQAVVSADGKPLIITSHQGRGRVTVLLFSPDRDPFLSWKNRPSFWAKLVGVPSELYTTQNVFSRGESSVDGVFGAMIDSKQIRKLPVEWLLLLLIVYLLVIGPLDQFWLKRIKRPMLTWITFPCYVVLFSLLIYFIGYKLRAGETEWNELHFVDVLSRGEAAELRGRTYASIYSPVNSNYKLEGQEHFSTFRGEFLDYGGTQETDRADVLQAGDNFKADIFVHVWTSQLYVSDWWQSEDEMPVQLGVVSEGPNWSVTVTNRRDRPLSNTRIALAGRIIDLGEVPAGQVKTFKVGRGQGSGIQEFVQRFSSSFQRSSQERRRAFGATGGGRIDNLPDSSMALSFISQQQQTGFIAPPGLDLSPLTDQGLAVLLAWESGFSPFNRPMNLFPTRRSHKDTLWRVAVPISPGTAPPP